MMSASSVISLRSISDGSIADGYERAGSRPSSASRKQRKPASPYGSTAPTLTKKVAKKTGREAWVDAVKNGGGISSACQVMNTWRNGKHSKKNKTASSSNFLLDQLLLASGSPLPNKHVRPSSGVARVGGTGPVYKDAETYYEEIQTLRRKLKELKNENSEMKAKNLRMDEEVVAKSRVIEELLNPESQSNDMVRTLTAKNPAATEVVMSLRRKIYKLEETLRDKETEVRKMNKSIKQTNMEEVMIENQMYLYEIRRLTHLIQEAHSYGEQNAVTEELITDALKDNKGNKAQILIKRLTEDNQHLVLENKSLKNDLMKLSKISQTDVDLSKDYEDMNRKELLQKLSTLEQRLKQEEKKIAKDDLELTVDSEVNDGCIEIKGPLPQQIKQLRAREKELLAEVEKLGTTVQKLKDDRTHYRKMTDDYRQQLENMKKITDEAGSDTASIRSEKSPKCRRKSSPDRKGSFDRKVKVKKDSADTSKKIQELAEKNAARKIQRGWRMRQNMKKNTYDDNGDDLENAVTSIQCAWRANKSRKDYIDSVREHEYSSISITADDSNLKDDDVLMIQSSFRGHSTRKQLLRKGDSSSRLTRGSSATNMTDDGVLFPPDEETTDDDDDVVIGSSSSLSNFRPDANISSFNKNSNKFRTSLDASGEKASLANVGKDVRRESSSGKQASRETSFGNRMSRENSDIRNHIDRKSFINENCADRKTSTGNHRKVSQGNSNFIGGRRMEMEKESLHSFHSDEDEKEKDKRVSLNTLKSKSSPWFKSNRESEESEDDDVIFTSNKSRKSSKKEKSQTKGEDQKDLTNNKWAKSGTKNDSKQDGFQKSLARQKSQQLLQSDDDDESVVIAPSLRKKLSTLNNRKSQIEDELF